jgi:putative transcriptional regulator
MTPDSAREVPSPHIGRLLVASPALLDPNFFRAVVLVCDDEGELGLILNRPSESPVAEFLPMWVVDEPQVVFFGGPVQPEVAVGLAQPSDEDPIGFTPVTAGIGLFDLATPPEFVGLEHLRVFSGYSGWDTGQLEAELANGDWIVVDSDPGDLFDAEPATLWSRVLGRQGGELALLASFPIDPTLN